MIKAVNASLLAICLLAHASAGFAADPKPSKERYEANGVVIRTLPIKEKTSPRPKEPEASNQTPDSSTKGK